MAPYDLFLRLVQQWNDDLECLHYDHFGRYLLYTAKFQTPFCHSSPSPKGLFPIGLLYGRNTATGLLTSVVFNGTSLALTLACPGETTLIIPLLELRSLEQLNNRHTVSREQKKLEGRGHVRRKNPVRV